MVKCIELSTLELEKTDLEIIERNILQLDEIEKKGLERINESIAKLNSIKDNIPNQINKLKQNENEKLQLSKDQQENNKRDVPVLDDLEILKTKEKSDLLVIKKDLDQKLGALKLSLKINKSKIKSGAEFKLLKFDDSVLKNFTEIFIQFMSPSILVIFVSYLTKQLSKLIKADRALYFRYSRFFLRF